jgi:hypothetical protein
VLRACDALGAIRELVAAVSIGNPDDPPSAWQQTWREPPAQAWDATVGAAVARDGDAVMALAIDADHHGMLARISELRRAAGRSGPPSELAGDAHLQLRNLGTNVE